MYVFQCLSVSMLTYSSSRDASPVYNNLAIDDSYFQSETVDAISDHILALYGAKLQAFTRNDPESIVIELEKVTDSSMVFIHTSPPGQTSTTGPGATCERR